VRRTPGKLPGDGVDNAPASQPGGLEDLARNNPAPEDKQHIDWPPAATLRPAIPCSTSLKTLHDRRPLASSSTLITFGGRWCERETGGVSLSRVRSTCKRHGFN